MFTIISTKELEKIQEKLNELEKGDSSKVGMLQEKYNRRWEDIGKRNIEIDQLKKEIQLLTVDETDFFDKNISYDENKIISSEKDFKAFIETYIKKMFGTYLNGSKRTQEMRNFTSISMEALSDFRHHLSLYCCAVAKREEDKARKEGNEK